MPDKDEFLNQENKIKDSSIRKQCSMIRIHSLEASNVQILKHVRYVFDQKTNALEVCGLNRQGKSTFLNLLAMLFCGRNLIPDQPIRDGEETGFAECKTNEFVVRLDFSYGKEGNLKTKLTVTPIGEKKEIKSPQTFLNEKLASYKSLNPVELLNKHPKELRDIVLDLVDLDIDLDEHEKECARIYDLRTVQGRMVQGKKALRDEIEIPDDWADYPKVEVSTLALTEKYQKAVNRNAENQRIRESLVSAANEVVKGNTLLSELDMAVKEKDSEVATASTETNTEEQNVADLAGTIKGLVGVDTVAIEKEIRSLQEKLEAGRKQNIENAWIVESLEPAQEKVRTLKAQKEKMLQGKVVSLSKITAAKESIKTAMAKVADIQYQVDGLVDVNTDFIGNEMQDIQETNDVIRTIKLYQKAENDVVDAKAVYDDYTCQLEEKNQEKDSAIARAKFPVKGMSVDSKGLVYKGKRFEVASTAERLDVLISIHFALNPDVRFIIIHDASTLDSFTMQYLVKKAEKEDFYIFFEIVEHARLCKTDKLIIHEGEIVNALPLPQLEAA